jgi:hypothetical protein
MLRKKKDWTEFCFGIDVAERPAGTTQQRMRLG